MGKDLKSIASKQKMYVIVGSIAVILVVFIILFNVLGNKGKNSNSVQFGESQNSSNEILEQASSSIGKGIEDYEEVNTVENTVEDNSIQNVQQGEDTTVSKENLMDQEIIDEAVVTNAAEQSKEQVQEVVKDPTFIMPVEGELVKHYGKEKLIYSDTLKEWTTHLGIDIKAEKTTIVKASCDGCVKSIKNDPRYGLTITIEHENGFTSVYSNLLSSEFVALGDKVKTGQTIGTVGNSATFEILDAPHLHFEILKDGESVDPEMYIK